MVTQREIKSYIRQVKKACPFSFRRKMLFSLKSGIADYIEENPDSSIDDIINHFGLPKNFATEFVASIDDKKFLRNLSVKTAIKYAAIIGFVIVVLLTVIICIIIGVERARPALPMP